MSEKVIRLVSTAILLILFFAGVPVVAASQDGEPPQKMLEHLANR